MIRHARSPYGAQIDGVELAELFEAVLRHHATGAGEDLAAPVEGGPLKIETKAASGRLQHAHAFGHHFLADPVARNHRNPMCHPYRSLHTCSSPSMQSCHAYFSAATVEG